MLRRMYAVPLALAGLVALAALAAPASAQSSWLDERLPAERALGYLRVEPREAIAARFDHTDLGKLWGQLAAFRAELMTGLEGPLQEGLAQIEKETGVKPETLLAALEGGFEIGVLNLGEPGAEPRPALVLAAPKSAGDALSALIGTIKAQMGEEAPPIEVHAGDMTLVTVMCAPEDLLERGAEGALADDEAFADLKLRTWGEDAVRGGEGGAYYLFLNAKAMLALAPPDPQLDNARATLGLDDLEAIGLGLGFGRGRFHEGLALRTSAERTGIFKMIADQPALDVRAIANRTPHDVLSFTAASLDLQKLWTDGLALAEGMEPGTKARVEDQLLEMEVELGFTVQELLGAFGSTWTVESHVPEHGLALLPETVFGADVRDAAKLRQILGDVAAMAGMEVKTLTKEGLSVNYLLSPLGKLGEDPFETMDEDTLGGLSAFMSVIKAWTIKDGRIYFSSSPQALLKRWDRLKVGALTESEGFKRTAATAKPDARMFGYSRPDRAAGQVYNLAAMAVRIGEPFLRAAGIPVDAALLPGADEVAGTIGPGMTQWHVGERAMTLQIEGGAPLMSTAGGAAFAAVLAFSGARASAPRPVASPEMALYTLLDAQEAYMAMNGAYASSFDDLIAHDLIDPAVVFGTPGYSLRFAEAGPDQGYKVVAEPVGPGRPAYFVTRLGVTGPLEMPGASGRSMEPARPERVPAEPGPSEAVPGEPAR